MNYLDLNQSNEMATPPKVRRTSFPESSATTRQFIEPSSLTTINNNNDSHRHVLTVSSLTSSRNFKGSVPWSTALIQIVFITGYLVFLWLPLGEVTGTQITPTTSSLKIPSWYLHLSARVTLHGLVYLLVGAVGLYVFRRHKVTQQRGYLKFYRSMNMLRRLPIFTMSIVNVLLFPLWIFTSFDICTVDVADKMLRCLIAIECVIILPCLIQYIIKVRQHNISAPFPDAQQVMSSTFSPNSGVGNGVGVDGSNNRNSNLGTGRTSFSGGIISPENGNAVSSTPELRRYQADVVKW